MAKHNLKATERTAKKPRVDSPSLPSKRKGSPHPKFIPNEIVADAAPVLSAKVKGKQREVAKLKDSLKTKTIVEDDAPAPPSTFKVVAGSYEKLLYGIEGSTSAEPTQASGVAFHLKPIFVFPAHVSCIKAVAASPHGGKWLATGSADEIVKVWDLRRRKEIGGLMHHEGSITHLLFPSRSHLLSASEDGTLCLFRARDWAVLRALKGHKGRVNAVAVHPSGKVALSVGKDNTLRMWDLMRGKGSASTKLGKEGEIVRWSTDGSMFAVQAQSSIDLYTTDMVLLHTIRHPARLHDLKFCRRINGAGEILFAAAEDKKLSIYDVSVDPDKIPRVVAEMVGHQNRVKAVDTLVIALPAGSTRAATTIVSTVSSDGKIRVFDLAALPDPAASVAPQKVVEITAVAEYDSKGTRLTCVTLAEGEAEAAPKSGKRKREVDTPEDEAQEEDELEEHEDEQDGWVSDDAADDDGDGGDDDDDDEDASE